MSKFAVPSMLTLILASPFVLSANDPVTVKGDGAISIRDTSASASSAQSVNAGVLLKQRMHSMHQYRSAFAQTVTDAQGNIVHEAKGVLTMMRPNKLRWETTFPDETLLIADGEAVWNFDTFVEQVTIIDQQQAIKDNPIVLLTANDAATWDSFVISKLDSDEEQYQVVPKVNDGQIRSLTLGFDNAGVLVSLDMLDAQEQTSALVFRQPELVFDLGKGVFAVDVPSSFIVDDQR